MCQIQIGAFQIAALQKETGDGLGACSSQVRTLDGRDAITGARNRFQLFIQDQLFIVQERTGVKTAYLPEEILVDEHTGSAGHIDREGREVRHPGVA